MKHTLLVIMTALILAIGGKQLNVIVLTPTPAMHCQNCENKIKGNMRFEKGIKKIETNIEAQTVTITYDPAATSAEKIQKAMKNIGYDTKVVSNKVESQTKRSEKSKKSDKRGSK